MTPHRDIVPAPRPPDPQPRPAQALAIQAIMPNGVHVHLWADVTGVRCRLHLPGSEPDPPAVMVVDEEVDQARRLVEELIATIARHVVEDAPDAGLPTVEDERGKRCAVHDWAVPCAPCRDEAAGVVGRRCLIHHFTLPCHSCLEPAPSGKPRPRTSQQEREFDRRHGLPATHSPGAGG